MSGPTLLPGAPATDDGDRVVCHVDMDCFYAACERLREPALRGEPVVVGMGYRAGDTGGAVATASYEAREVGVESAQPITTALERLPRRLDARATAERAGDEEREREDPGTTGFYRPVDMAYYEQVAEEVTGVLRKYADTVREVSIDEAYLDLTPVGWADAAEVARELKETVSERVGVTASVGVAPTMSAAKVASDRDKPDGLVVVEPGEVREFFAPLDVEAVHGVGPVTASELRDRGVEMAGDLARADPEALAEAFGERGLTVRRYARGEDDREVEPRGRPKSLSRESAFSEATDDPKRQRERVRTLATAVADRADREGALYQTIGVKAVQPPFDVNTRAESLSGPVADAELVRERAMALFAEFAGDPVRKVGVRVSNLSFAEGDQASLDSYAAGAEPDRETSDPETAGQWSLDQF